MSKGYLTYDEMMAGRLLDPVFRAQWEATALAREVSLWARLEEGDHEPRIATLRRLSEVLGMRLSLSIEPPAETSSDGSRVTVAIG
ncbi:MAG: hypothetical protein HYU66_20605 [Armatimonadetes bacterium]|nr:hypothetical protein [Armatimonadota bacterium]